MQAVSLLLSFPWAFYWATTIINLCFGSDYRPGSQVITWLLVSLFFMIPNIVLTQAALAINRENHYALGAVSARLAEHRVELLADPNLRLHGCGFWNPHHGKRFC